MSSPIPEEAPVTSAVRGAPWSAAFSGEVSAEVLGVWAGAVVVIVRVVLSLT